MKRTSEEGVTANEQTTRPKLQWDTVPEGDNMDFGCENENFHAGQEILHLTLIAL